MRQPANTDMPPRLARAFDLYFACMGFGPTRATLRGQRLAEALRLDALPDAALAQMRIARRDIPRIVYRELFSA